MPFSGRFGRGHSQIGRIDQIQSSKQRFSEAKFEASNSKPQISDLDPLVRRWYIGGR